MFDVEAFFPIILTLVTVDTTVLSFKFVRCGNFGYLSEQISQSLQILIEDGNVLSLSSFLSCSFLHCCEYFGFF